MDAVCAEFAFTKGMRGSLVVCVLAEGSVAEKFRKKLKQEMSGVGA